MDPRRRQPSASMSVKSEDVRAHTRRASHSVTPLEEDEGELTGPAPGQGCLAQASDWEGSATAGQMDVLPRALNEVFHILQQLQGAL